MIHEHIHEYLVEAYVWDVTWMALTTAFVMVAYFGDSMTVLYSYNVEVDYKKEAPYKVVSLPNLAILLLSVGSLPCRMFWSHLMI